MPDVRKCPHCFREITPGDAERMARAEIEAGLRREFNLLHSEEIARAKRSERFRILAFFSTLVVLLVTLLSSVLFTVEDLQKNGISVYPLILPFILGICIFWMAIFAPSFLDTRKSLDEQFNKFKLAHGLL